MTGTAGPHPLEAALGHAFADPELLAAALVHRSYTAEVPDVPDNERLELLGDAVLQLAVTDYLYAAFPTMREGEMAKARAAVVSRPALAAVARRLGVGGHLLVGVGEAASGGREKDSILADAMEAVIAAVYLDGGFEAARAVVLPLWEEAVLRTAEAPGSRDFKTRLQEVLAARGETPVYEVAGTGPDHARVFVADVSVAGRAAGPLGSGRGNSKKEAQQAAARAALESLGES